MEVDFYDYTFGEENYSNYEIYLSKIDEKICILIKANFVYKNVVDFYEKIIHIDEIRDTIKILGLKYNYIYTIGHLYMFFKEKFSSNQFQIIEDEQPNQEIVSANQLILNILEDDTNIPFLIEKAAFYNSIVPLQQTNINTKSMLAKNLCNAYGQIRQLSSKNSKMKSQIQEMEEVILLLNCKINQLVLDISGGKYSDVNKDSDYLKKNSILENDSEKKMNNLKTKNSEPNMIRIKDLQNHDINTGVKNNKLKTNNIEIINKKQEDVINTNQVVISQNINNKEINNNNKITVINTGCKNKEPVNDTKLNVINRTEQNNSQVQAKITNKNEPNNVLLRKEIIYQNANEQEIEINFDVLSRLPKMPFSDSLIIKNNSDYSQTLENWIYKNVRLSFGFYPKLLYRATRDNHKASQFHLLCDNKGPTLIIILDKSGNIYGGYTSSKWESTQGKIYKIDNDSFLYNLNNKKYLKINNMNRAIVCSKDYGPIFGGEPHDLIITDKFLGNKKCLDNTGKFMTYSTSKSFDLNGKNELNVVELEVYEILY